MNTYMKLIIEVLGCDEAKAREVFDELCSWTFASASLALRNSRACIKEANEQLATKAA
jgi:hypothetical protein